MIHRIYFWMSYFFICIGSPPKKNDFLLNFQTQLFLILQCVTHTDKVCFFFLMKEQNKAKNENATNAVRTRYNCYDMSDK